MVNYLKQRKLIGFLDEFLGYFVRVLLIYAVSLYLLLPCWQHEGSNHYSFYHFKCFHSMSVLLQLKQPLDILDEYPEARICLPVSKNTASQSTECFAVGVDANVTNQPVRVQTKVERLSKIACDLLYNGKYDNSKQCYSPKIKSQDLKGETFSGMLTCKNGGYLIFLFLRRFFNIVCSSKLLIFFK